MLTESLERRFEEDFGIARTFIERNELLSQRVQKLERDISGLSGWRMKLG